MKFIGTRVGRLLLASWLTLVALAGIAALPAQAAERPRILIGEYNGYSLPADTDRYVAAAGTKPDMVMWFQSWDEPLYWDNQMAGIAARDVTPLITWSPGSNFTMEGLLAGRHDAYLVEQAKLAKAWGKPLMIRPFHEMNGTWQSFGPQATSSESFVRGWRHVVDVFRSQGAFNVKWVWTPNITGFGDSTSSFERLYPGDSYTDWVGLDGYNFGSPWRSARTLFEPSYRAMTALTSRPLMIAEWGSAERGGDKAAWIKQFFEDIPTVMPELDAVVTFSRVAEEDFRIDSSASALAAYRSALQGPAFTGAWDDAPSLPAAAAPARAPAPAASDLVVSDVTWAPQNPLPGQRVNFSAKVENRGSAPTPAGITIGVAFLVDGRKVTWSSSSQTSLAPGQQRVLLADGGPAGSATWAATAGQHEITAVVDDVDRIRESNETNNRQTKVLAPAPAASDLVVSDVTWAPQNPLPGQRVNFSAKVENRGSAPTPAGITIGVAFLVDGRKVTWSSSSQTSLAPGQQRVLLADGGPAGSATWAATAGQHAITAVVDDVDRIHESNETNNRYTKSLPSR